MRKTAAFLLIFIFLAITFQSGAQHVGKSSVFKKDPNLPAITMNVNLVGIALYGPIIQVEFKVTDRSYIVPWIRYNYAGFVSTYEWTNNEDDSEYNPSSISIAAGYRSYIKGNSRKQSIYCGIFGEFIHENGLHNMNSDYEYEQTRQAIAVYANLGYQWKIKRNLYLNLGILPGFAFDLKNQGLYSSGASEGLEYDDFKKNKFVGMFDISLGWNLQR
jgi:hypothetical protein